ncbi:MAG: type II toxin-antitoxin system RelE/ParE family toxin [Arenimonas sp.]|nr:type II toxin-antitoxin system RelE/ParE family toxin [Arenimonas sp.]
MPYEIRRYITATQQDVFLAWFSALRDRQAKIRIAQRLTRLELGQFGDCKPCRDGIWELRINSGPGYRIYYALNGRQIILLLCAGDKSTQKSDINRASAFWQDWQTR